MPIITRSVDVAIGSLRLVCACGLGQHCNCWEADIHRNPRAVKLRGRNRQQAITVRGEDPNAAARLLVSGG